MSWELMLKNSEGEKDEFEDMIDETVVNNNFSEDC